VFAYVGARQETERRDAIPTGHAHSVAREIVGKRGAEGANEIHFFADALFCEDGRAFAHHFEQNFHVFVEVAPQNTNGSPQERCRRTRDTHVKKLSRLGIACNRGSSVHVMKS